MSKRLQVLLPDREYQELQKASRHANKTVADWVRELIRDSLRQARPEDPEKKLARILSFAKYDGPTGDIEAILGEIEKGRALD